MPRAIDARNLHKSYTYREGGLLRGRKVRVRALRGVSFSVEWGSIYGLLGPNGAGKTTAIKIIATLLIPDEGEALVSGYSSISEPVEVRKLIGVMLSVERGFFWKLTGRENLKYFGLLYGLAGRELEERIDWALSLVGLDSLGGGSRRFEEMSLGMRARLGLARALLKDPPVLILDEPTLGLDPPSARVIRRLLKDMASRGKSVLVTTHNMAEAEYLCDRIGIIDNGRIVAEGTPEELKRSVAKYSSIYVTLSGNREQASVILEKLRERLGIVAGVVGEDNGLQKIRILAEPGTEPRVLTALLSQASLLGVKALEHRIEAPTLEDVFIKIVKGGG
ncbi:MAG: ABC transporter ATP-binding protein [Desulfurococcales archaeon]|nr:ABC transporter ATP-binding protein [Desulfurococcales archaeon]